MLTPIDIQNHVLKSTMGGYNKKAENTGAC